jgi:TetR/AcrR family transcriptional repressor of nem operon
MARPKAFDPGEAMQEAMEAFWERGYHATSVNDLLAEMKLNRGSLYGTFGDKKSLFLAALTEYERQGRSMMQEILERPGPAREAIEQLVIEAGRMSVGPAGQKGCLGLKAAMEMAPQDEDVANFVRQVTREREKMVAKVIKRGQAEGDIRRDLDPRAAARFLFAAVAGLRVMGSSAPSQREVREVVNLILRVLD